MQNIPSQLLSAAMLRACEEARQWVGATAPNPPVGAVALDEHGTIMAAAAHRRAGTSHAEAALLEICRENNLLPRVNTLCVTLEPCSHFGRTPPCSQAIIDAGIRRVVVGARDPNPDVKGGGIERLREAGLEVIEGVEAEPCRRLIHAFAYFVTTGAPFVTVKRAFDSRGSMVPPPGSKTFTGPNSLLLAHCLRKKAGALITGSGTILSDNPLFTVRQVNDFPEIRRVVALLDRRKRIGDAYIEAAKQRHLDVIRFDDLDSCFEDLKKRKIQDVLVESGPILSQAVLDSGHWTLLVDIFKGEPDDVKVTFNPRAKIPFDSKGFDLNSILPLQTDGSAKPRHDDLPHAGNTEV